MDFKGLVSWNIGFAKSLYPCLTFSKGISDYDELNRRIRTRLRLNQEKRRYIVGARGRYPRAPTKKSPRVHVVAGLCTFRRWQYNQQTRPSWENLLPYKNKCSLTIPPETENPQPNQDRQLPHDSCGCQSSTLFPSGSMNHPKLPYSLFSISPTTWAPPAATWLRASSRLSTTRLNMNSLLEGAK
jgi:hypothetical protein